MPYYPCANSTICITPRDLRIARHKLYVMLRRQGYTHRQARIRSLIEFPRKERR